MSGPETKKLDELFRSLPKNAGVDPRLVEAARTELNLLKFHAGAQVLNHKQVNTVELQWLEHLWDHEN